MRWAEPADTHRVARVATTLRVLVPGLLASLSIAWAEDHQASSWLIPVIRPFHAHIGAGVEYEPTTDSDPGSYARSTTRTSLVLQPWQSATQELTVSGSWTQTVIDSDRSFPDGPPLPDRLRELRLGAVYRHVDAGGRILGLAVGSRTTDRNPFTSGEGTALSATAFYRMPLERDAWVFSLTYTESSAILGGIPLPGVLYQWRPQPTLTALLGLPVTAVIWRPTPRASLDAFVSVFGTSRVTASYAPLAEQPWLRTSLSAAYGGETFGWPEQLDEDDRVIFRAARISLGVDAIAGPMGRIGIGGGWQFARAVVLGESLFDRTTTLHLEPGLVLTASGMLRF